MSVAKNCIYVRHGQAENGYWWKSDRRDHQQGGHRKQNAPGNGDRNGAEGNVLILGTRVRSEYYRANIEALKRFAKENGGRFFLLRAEREEILAPGIFYGTSSGCRVYSKGFGVSSFVCRPRVRPKSDTKFRLVLRSQFNWRPTGWLPARDAAQ